MKIALFGPTGMIGSRILKEALSRGYEVTAIMRDSSTTLERRPHLDVKTGDILDAGSVAEAVRGSDVVISAFGPGSGDPQLIVAAARSLIDGVKRSGVKRLIAVSGAGSLEVKPGLQLVDTPNFPAMWKPLALAHRDAVEVYRKADLDWTALSPAAIIEPGERTGKFRISTDQLLTDAKGESRISVEDYAIALLDEAEHPKFIRKRFAVAH
jgi:putative NADH-flavin reductase